MNQFPHQVIAIVFIIMTASLLTHTSRASDDSKTIEKLGNATYTGIEDGPITLSNGIWEGAPYGEDAAARPRAGLVEDLYLTGDLEGDGKSETAAFLWQNTGGTGNFIHVAIMKRTNEGFSNFATALVGDRVKLRNGNIALGQIILEVLQAGENDAMCCPTMLATRTWSLTGGQLEEGPIEETGTLSLSVLEGSEWALTHLNLEEPLTGDTGVTLAFDAKRILGKSACNRYSAAIEDGDNPGDISIGPSMSTRMACPDELMKLETEYLDALLNSTGFSFYAGSLVLNGQKDGTPFSMLFSRVEIPHDRRVQ